MCLLYVDNTQEATQGVFVKVYRMLLPLCFICFFVYVFIRDVRWRVSREIALQTECLHWLAEVVLVVVVAAVAVQAVNQYTSSNISTTVTVPWLVQVDTTLTLGGVWTSAELRVVDVQ